MTGPPVARVEDLADRSRHPDMPPNVASLLIHKGIAEEVSEEAGIAHVEGARSIPNRMVASAPVNAAVAPLMYRPVLTRLRRSSRSRLRKRRPRSISATPKRTR
jgi:hypothetical protein